MQTVDLIGGILMWLGGVFWVASIICFFQTRFMGSNPGTRWRWPLLLYKHTDLNEYGLRSQMRFKVCCLAYISCWVIAVLIAVWIAMNKTT